MRVDLAIRVDSHWQNLVNVSRQTSSADPMNEVCPA